VKHVTICDRKVGEGEPAFIIAEIGSNFDGQLERARLMVDLALEAGADAAKFQSFLPDRIIAPEGFTERDDFQAKWAKPVYDVYADAVFPREWHQEIAGYSEERGLIFLSSPYDTEAVDLLISLGAPALKIGSGEVSNPPFLWYCASQGVPLILGVGSATLAEVDEAMRVFQETGVEDVILLQCVTSYPSPFEDANLRAMVTLGRMFDVPVGYSDHTPGHVVPLGAVALGGCVIEKHMTDDRSRPGPDHPFSLEVGEFRKMVEDVRKLETALGRPTKQLAPAERNTVILQRRSLWAARDIPKGTVLTREMVDILRPQKGILPRDLDKVLGLRSTRDARAGHPLTWEHFK
jgi:N-acetylneuraminate synthase